MVEIDRHGCYEQRSGKTRWPLAREPRNGQDASGQMRYLIQSSDQHEGTVDAPTKVISRGDHDRRNKRRLGCGIMIA